MATRRKRGTKPTTLDDLARWNCSHEDVVAALKAARYTLPHGRVSSLRAPHVLVPGDLGVERLALTTGTVVVGGDLTVSRTLDIQRDGRPLVNLLVLGAARLGLVYLDGFLVVRRDLDVDTFVGDTRWSGGLYVGGAVRADCLILHDTDASIRGRTHARVLVSSEDRAKARRDLPELFGASKSAQEGPADPRGFFLAHSGRKAR